MLQGGGFAVSEREREVAQTVRRVGTGQTNDRQTNAETRRSAPDTGSKFPRYVDMVETARDQARPHLPEECMLHEYLEAFLDTGSRPGCLFCVF